MLRDIGGSLWGTLVFSLALFAPGYVVGCTTNVCEFRMRGLREQLAWSVVLSFGVGTLLVVAAVWVGGAAGGAVALSAIGLAASAFIAHVLPFRGKDWRSALPYSVLAVFLCALVTGSLVDIASGPRLFMSVTAYDSALRTAFVDAVLRTGVPPSSPLYWPGHDAPMRYYYFWYVVCAAVAKAGHISARQALIASSTWSMFGVEAALALTGRHLLGWQGAELKRRWWIAVGLVGVTGLDGLIAFLVYLHSRTVARDIEWWSLDQVTSWIDTFLWVPHHAAALVCSLLCFLLIWLSTQEARIRLWCVKPILAGMAFASAFGLSTYVAITTLLVLGMWIVRELYRGELRKSWRVYAIVAASAMLSLAPYLSQLLHSQIGAKQRAGSALTLGVRELLPPMVLSGLPGLSQLHITHPHAAKEIAAALLIVPSYFLEFGFFALALVVLQRKRDKTSGERALLFLTWAGLLSVSVVRSRVIAMNDYSVRGSLIPQFLMLLAGVLALERCKSLPRLFLLGFLAVGLLGSIYQVILLRSYLPIHEIEGDVAYTGLSHQNYALRDAYTEMGKKVPVEARVQFSVPNRPYTGFAQLANIGHQVIVDSDECNNSFGGDDGACAAIEKTIKELFSAERALSASETVALCRSIGAEYLVAARWDPVWQQPVGWARTLPVVVVRPDVRIVSCTAPNS